MTRKLLLCLWLVALGLVAPATASAAKLDIGLVIDGSGSIDDDDWRLQREGFATALRDPANVPLDGSIAIAVVQFSSGTTEEVPRTLIDSQEKLDGVVSKIENLRQRNSGTDPGRGVQAGVAALGELRTDAKAVLCLSTDGTTNEGPALDTAVIGAQTAGIDRFSVIGIEDYGGAAADLREHYGRHVYGGGAVTVARNTVEFASLISGSCFGEAVTLRALEVNQGVQDWKNSQPLLQQRETVVRAFVETTPGAPSQRVSGRLIGRRDGVELPGSPLVATNDAARVLAREDIGARRGQIRDSLNFELPISWTLEDGLELEFDGGGAPVLCREPADPGTANDDCRVSLPLEARTELGVTFVRVSIGGTDEPSWDDTAEQVARVQSGLPVSELNWASRVLDYGERPTIGELNDDLHGVREIDRTSCRDACFGRDVYYGLLDGPAIGGLNGQANGIPGTVASSFTNQRTAPTSTGYARNTIVHELGHTLGVHHAVDNSRGISGGFLWWGGNKTGHCGEVASRDAPGHSPFITVGGLTRPGLGSIATPDDEVWGVDHRFARANENDLGLSDPREVWALMGYCSNGDGQFRWPSAFERGELIDGLRSRAANGGEAASETGEVKSVADVVTPPPGHRGVLISGTVDATTKAATISAALPLPYSGDAAPGAGAYTLRVEDPAGQVLAERRFTPNVRFGDGEGDGLKASFGEVVAIPQAATIGKVTVINATDGSLGTRSAAGGAAPTVGEVAISDPRIATAPVTLSWKRSAGSVSAVLFSPDDGATWRALAFRVTGESLVIHPDTLTATAAGRFAVATTDGLRGAVAQLEGITVSVANAAPTIEITSPRPGDPAPSGLQPIVFSAAAADRDEALGADAVVWRSDRDGELGRGATLTVGADRLSEGEHKITATVTDGQGASASASVTIEVFRVAPPPPSADKTVTLTAPQDPVTGGDVATVVATVENAGPSTARLVRLKASFPAGTAPRVPADSAGWACVVTGGELVCERDTLIPSARATLAIPVAVDDVPARTRRTVSVTVDAAVADPRPQDDAATASFDVVPRPPSPQPAQPSPTPEKTAVPVPSAAPSASPSANRPSVPALALRLRQSRAQLLTNKFDVSVVASCGPVACAARTTGSVRIAGRTWRLRTGRGQIAAGRHVRLRLASTKALRRAARATRKPLRVAVVVTVRGADGKVATQRVTVPVRSLRR